VKPENVLFFNSAADFRAWLEKNHESSDHQWVAVARKTAAEPGLKLADAVMEALCFGWIDGQGGRVGDALAVRFSKRRRGSIWSTINVGRMNSLIAEGRVAPAGMRAWEARRHDRTGVYMNDMANVELPDDLEAIFRANGPAWEFWSSCPPGYRRQMTWWVISAKRDETRGRRFEALVEQHASGQRIDPLHLPKVSQR
jgi:uncharacterized protein YdeI (YjbR/CyaY-like superfamily)